MFLWLIVLAAVLVPGGSALGLERFALERSPQLSEDAVVSVITVYPGPQAHEMFGHTGIRIRDEALGLDRMYDYGLFDFQDPLFFVDYLGGRLDYLVAGYPFELSLETYRQSRRAVVEQVINLTPEQRQELMDFLVWNEQPANREYRYRFFHDNCSTRVRDVLERVLGDRLSFAGLEPPGQTFRQMVMEYAADRPVTRLGINLAVGLPGDRAVSAHESMFLPLPLRDALDEAQVRREGEVEPLVLETQRLYWTESAERAEQTGEQAEPAWPWVTLLGWALFIPAAGHVAWQWWRREPAQMMRRSRWAMDGIFLGLVGLAGLVVLVLWVGTEHELTWWNWNLLWAWPTHLILAVALMRWRASRLMQGYLLATAGVAAVLVLGWAFWPQPLDPALLPVVLLLALRTAWIGWQFRREDQEPTEGADHAAQPG